MAAITSPINSATHHTTTSGIPPGFFEIPDLGDDRTGKTLCVCVCVRLQPFPGFQESQPPPTRRVVTCTYVRTSRKKKRGPSRRSSEKWLARGEKVFVVGLLGKKKCDHPPQQVWGNVVEKYDESGAVCPSETVEGLRFSL